MSDSQGLVTPVEALKRRCYILGQGKPSVGEAAVFLVTADRNNAFRRIGLRCQCDSDNYAEFYITRSGYIKHRITKARCRSARYINGDYGWSLEMG
jgi:hypothetical protein